MLYQRDYLNLLVKFGLEEPSQLAGAGRGDRAGLLSPDRSRAGRWGRSPLDGSRPAGRRPP